MRPAAWFAAAMGLLLAGVSPAATPNIVPIFTSDNGPVLNDGYQDEAVERAGSHRPSGPLHGGRYSLFEAGCRVPFIVRWPRGAKPAGATPSVPR